MVQVDESGTRLRRESAEEQADVNKARCSLTTAGARPGRACAKAARRPVKSARLSRHTSVGTLPRTGGAPAGAADLSAVKRWRRGAPTRRSRRPRGRRQRSFAGPEAANTLGRRGMRRMWGGGARGADSGGRPVGRALGLPRTQTVRPEAAATSNATSTPSSGWGRRTARLP
jgi:hypothetical protein